MGRQWNIDTENMDESEIKVMNKLASLKNNTQFEILKMLQYKENAYPREKNPIYKYAMTSKMIRKELKKIGIKISTQMVGQDLKKLLKAELVEREKLSKNPNGIRLENEAYGYYINVNAFEDIFLEINFLTEELKGLIDLYEQNQESIEGDNCVFTVFNGEDKGKKLIINENEEAFIGRMANYTPSDVGPFSLLLSNKYTTVSSIDKPHLRVYNKDGTWYMVDDSSTNGTYVGNNVVKKEKIKNNSFIRLSKGPGSAILYCSYE